MYVCVYVIFGSMQLCSHIGIREMAQTFSLIGEITVQLMFTTFIG